ncbi:MAG: hypothetical protein H7325_08935, partial [Pedobacter sp.]|nr:hypothetical protein [Pedobacter sp.]
KKKAIEGETLSYTQQIRWNRQEKAFWAKYFNNPPEPEAIPTHAEHLSFRSSDITDEEIGFLTGRVTSINMLDLDDAYITVETIKHLTRLEHLGELRLKGCTELYNDCVPYLNKIKGLQLLHLVGTNITIDGLVNMNTLTDLKKLFISADTKKDIALQMQRLKKELPACEFYVNYQLYEFE